jgi:hypothetical protein
MDKIDKKVRAVLLKPLSRGNFPRSDELSQQSLRQLEKRAVNDILVQIGAEKLKRREGGKARIDLDEWVRLVKALKGSGRITNDEYIFYMATRIEDLHEGNIDKSVYAHNISAIETQMEEIRNEYGLKPEEHWLIKDAPLEYKILSRQLDKILNDRLTELFKQQGLPDIVELRKRSPKVYEESRERGRRAIFHQKDHTHALKDTIIQLETDAEKAAAVMAYSAAVISLAAALEGLLLLRYLKSPKKGARIAAALPRRLKPNVDKPFSWTFEVLIEVCSSAGWFDQIVTENVEYETPTLAHLLRRTRNYIHPGRKVLERPWVTMDKEKYNEVYAMYYLVREALFKRKRGRRGNFGGFEGSLCLMISTIKNADMSS